MKYSLKQHLLGITDEEYTVVNNFEPPLEDELTEQKAEFVDTKEKSSGLFSAVIAQLVENRGAPRKMNYNFDEIDSDVDKNSFRDANKQRRMMDREESRSGSALNSADGRNPRDHMSNSELAADREWEAEQRGERQAMHGTEEEMETKMTANHDRDMEFQGNISRLSKSTDADNRASTPDNKRLKQRYNRYKRKTWGEEEMEQKMPANRDRVQGIVNRGFGDEAEGDPSIQRRGQRARRRLKADGYKGDRLNAAGRPSEEQEEENREAEDYILNRDRSHPNYRSSVERDDKAWEVGRETSGNNMPSKKRLKQKIGRFQRSVNGKASEEQEEQRMAPRGMNYKFDERPPAKGANRHKSLPTGKSGRGNRVVNNSLYRPKTKDEFVKDKAASAFKEGVVGSIFALAFEKINET